MTRTTLAFGIGLAMFTPTFAAAPAQAADVATVPLAGTTATARETAAFWLADGAANLGRATPYVAGAVVHGQRSTEPAVPDGKPGSLPPVRPEAAEADPVTFGKVFFVGADGLPHWCTGTAVQSNYRNLVATSGRCVLSSGTPFGDWVFVPGYTAGEIPLGLYVGKQVSVHPEFHLYADPDRDVAFVNVYSGVQQSGDGALTSTGRLVDNTGGQGFSWNEPVGPVRDVFGHPTGQGPYKGDLRQSSGPSFTMTLTDPPADHPVGVDSPFPGEGALGSAWLEGYSKREGFGYLNGVTIGVADTDGNGRHDTGVSSYFDSQTAAVYRAAGALWSGSILI